MIVLCKLYIVKVFSPWAAFELTVLGLSASGILTPRTWQFTFSMLILLSCAFIIYAFVNVVCGLLSEFFYFGSRKADNYFWQLLQNDELDCVWEIGDIALLTDLCPLNTSVLQVGIDLNFAQSTEPRGQWNPSVKHKLEFRMCHVSLKSANTTF